LRAGGFTATARAGVWGRAPISRLAERRRWPEGQAAERASGQPAFYVDRKWAWFAIDIKYAQPAVARRSRAERGIKADEPAAGESAHILCRLQNRPIFAIDIKSWVMSITKMAYFAIDIKLAGSAQRLRADHAQSAGSRRANQPLGRASQFYVDRKIGHFCDRHKPRILCRSQNGPILRST